MQKSFSNGYTEYQVGNTSSCKNTEVKRHGPRLALGWVTIQKVGRGCYIYKNTVKSQKRSNGACFLAPPPPKKNPQKIVLAKNVVFGFTIVIGWYKP